MIVKFFTYQTQQKRIMSYAMHSKRDDGDSDGVMIIKLPANSFIDLGGVS